MDRNWQALGRPSNQVAPNCLQAQIQADIKWRREEQERKKDVRERIPNKTNPHKIIRKQPAAYGKKPKQARGDSTLHEALSNPGGTGR